MNKRGDREALARQALAEEQAAYGSREWKARLRREAKKAGLPTGAYTAFLALVAARGIPTFRELQLMCGGMSSSTLRDSLRHLERHKWITRIQLPGRGGPVLYKLHIGEPCQCRPGRGHPTTSTERMRKLRAKQSKDVTLTRSKDVTLTRSKDVTLNGSKSGPDVTRMSVTSPRSEAEFPEVITGTTTEPTEGRRGAMQKGETRPPSSAPNLSTAADRQSPGQGQHPSSASAPEGCGEPNDLGMCVGGCGRPERRSCRTCWDHAYLEVLRLVPEEAS